MSAQDVIVPGWPTPKGYSNGRVGKGQAVHVGGQIGWDANGKFAQVDPRNHERVGWFVAQFAQTLDNVIAVVAAAGGAVEDIADMTVYVTDMDMYRSSRKELGAVWRERLGKHYPAMALVAVTALFEREALVEIQAVAYIGESP
ncbi:MAG: RidA family protein [Deltaproteobacteria bacterium]|nr:RidA family protein [Deltaproteobacteria bacterium]